MQTETWSAGREQAVKALAAEQVLTELAERSRAYYRENSAPTGVMSGLIVALPLSLGLWIVIAALVWMLLR